MADAPDWLEMPADDYELVMWFNNDNVQQVKMSRDEYIALKQ